MRLATSCAPLGRRTLIKNAAAFGALAALLDGRAAFAAAPTDRRMVLVILRGGLDGLNAVVPYGDPDYAPIRPNIAIKRPGGDGGALDLDGQFGLHPGLKPIHGWFAERALIAVPAVAGPDRTRSHFDAQDTLENGSLRARGRTDGWLNRALVAMGGRDRAGLAVGHSMPLVLRGPAAVRTWAPAILPALEVAFLDRVDAMYAADPAFRQALRDGRRSAMGAAKALGERKFGVGVAQPQRAFPAMAEAAGKLLAAASGPRVATLESEGWDTHVNQAYALHQALASLAEGLAALRQGLGTAWASTVVVVASEFGRTAAENGGRGTDHGTAGTLLLAGGAVAGGRIVGRWPGLARSALFEGRDLAPVTDLRAVFKSVLRDHAGLPEAALEDRIFPDSRAAAAVGGLIRRV